MSWPSVKKNLSINLFLTLLLFLCRLSIKACVVFVPLLGVTWLFGLLFTLHKSFVYIFTILNSMQVSSNNSDFLSSKFLLMMPLFIFLLLRTTESEHLSTLRNDLFCLLRQITNDKMRSHYLQNIPQLLQKHCPLRFYFLHLAMTWYKTGHRLDASYLLGHPNYSGFVFVVVACLFVFVVVVVVLFYVDSEYHASLRGVIILPCDRKLPRGILK